MNKPSFNKGAYESCDKLRATAGETLTPVMGLIGIVIVSARVGEVEESSCAVIEARCGRLLVVLAER